MWRVILLLTLVLALTLGTVFAQEGRKKGPPKDKPSIEEKFNRLDADKDGKLSLEEFKGKATKPEQIQRREKIFKMMDTNQDGFVTLEEFKAFHSKRQ